MAFFPNQTHALRDRCPRRIMPPGVDVNRRAAILSICLVLVALAAGCGTDRVTSTSPVAAPSAASAPVPVRPSGTVDELVRVGDGRCTSDASVPGA